MVRYIFMSFKPLYATKIIKGEKDCEVRTYFGPIDIDDNVLIYASTPMRAVLGEFRVADVIIGDYNDVVAYIYRCCTMFDEDNWAFVRQRYAESRRRLIVIKIRDVRVFPRAIPLSKLKEEFEGFRPPMSYTTITEHMYRKILELSSL